MNTQTAITPPASKSTLDRRRAPRHAGAAPKAAATPNRDAIEIAQRALADANVSIAAARFTAAWNELQQDTTDDTDEINRLSYACDDCLIALSKAPAATIDGAATKVGVIRTYLRPYLIELQPSMESPSMRVVTSLFDDIERLSANARLPRAESPDADLIKACMAFNVIEAGYNSLHEIGDAGDVDEDVIKSITGPMVEAQRPIIARLIADKPVTLAGHIARARSFALWAPELADVGQAGFAGMGTAGEFQAAIIRDLCALEPSPTTSRALPVVSVDEGEDAALIKLCAEFDGLEAAYIAIHNSPGGGDPSEDQQQAIDVRQRALLDQINATVAVTPAGWQAKANTLALWAPWRADMGSAKTFWDDQMMAGLVRDVSSRPGLYETIVEMAQRRVENGTADPEEAPEAAAAKEAVR